MYGSLIILQNVSTSSITCQISPWFNNLGFNTIFSALINKLLCLKNICIRTKILTCRGHVYGCDTAIGCTHDYNNFSCDDRDEFWTLWLNHLSSWKHQQMEPINQWIWWIFLSWVWRPKSRNISIQWSSLISTSLYNSLMIHTFRSNTLAQWNNKWFHCSVANGTPSLFMQVSSLILFSSV